MKTTANSNAAQGVSRKRVQASFARAASQYDTHSPVQQALCRQLLQQFSTTLQRTAAAVPQHLADAGCGTGFALPLLQKAFPQTQCFALDLALPMLARARQYAPVLCADLHHLPLQSGTLDCYWSNLALQWCDLPRALAEARRVLRVNGFLVFSTLLPDTFQEIRHAFGEVEKRRAANGGGSNMTAAANQQAHTLDFLSATQIHQSVHAAGFVIDTAQQQRITVHYPDSRELLLAIKNSGAGQSPNRRPLSRAEVLTLNRALQAQNCGLGIPLSYDALLICAHATDTPANTSEATTKNRRG